MEVNGISRAELAQQLKEMGLSQNEKQILSIFDEVDSDESLKNVQHNDGKLSGVEMGELLKRAKDFLGEKAEQLREMFMKTGAFAELPFEFTYVEEAYDKNGNVVHRTEYDQLDKNKIANESFYEYDANGNISRGVSDYDGNGTIDGETRWEYNEAGKEVRMASYDGSGKLTYEVRNEYDLNGRLIHNTVDGDGDGRIDSEEHIKYDENGRLVLGTIDSDGDGTVDREWRHEYDVNGNETHMTYTQNGKIQSEEYNAYDEHGNFKGGTWVIHEEDGTLSTEDIKPIYDENGKVIGRAY